MFNRVSQEVKCVAVQMCRAVGKMGGERKFANEESVSSVLSFSLLDTLTHTQKHAHMS